MNFYEDKPKALAEKGTVYIGMMIIQKTGKKRFLQSIQEI